MNTYNRIIFLMSEKTDFTFRFREVFHRLDNRHSKAFSRRDLNGRMPTGSSHRIVRCLWFYFLRPSVVEDNAMTANKLEFNHFCFHNEKAISGSGLTVARLFNAERAEASRDGFQHLLNMKWQQNNNDYLDAITIQENKMNFCFHWEDLTRQSTGTIFLNF